MTRDEEQRLLAAALKGDDRSFAALVDANQQAVRAFVRRFTGHWEGAEDISQEAFVIAWAQLDRFLGETRFRSWVCGIAYRQARKARRAFERALRRDSDWSVMEGAVPEPRSADYVALRRAMNDLPDVQRAAVALCLAEGFTHSEAAAILELPLGTVKSHVARGRERLLKALCEARQ